MMSENFQERRIFLWARKPNPLFEYWLEEWSAESRIINSRKQFALDKALESLKKYPLVLHSGRDCSILDGFGNGICSMLDKQLAIFRNRNPNHFLPDANDVEQEESALVHTIQDLLERTEKNHVDELPVEAHTDTNLHNEDQSMLPSNTEIAIEKLFQKYGNLVEPERYLTMKQSIKEQPSAIIKGVLAKSFAITTKPVIDNVDEIYMKKNTFKIVLLVDTAETVGYESYIHIHKYNIYMKG